jgi:hypothetical protein
MRPASSRSALKTSVQDPLHASGSYAQVRKPPPTASRGRAPSAARSTPAGDRVRRRRGRAPGACQRASSSWLPPTACPSESVASWQSNPARTAGSDGRRAAVQGGGERDGALGQGPGLVGEQDHDVAEVLDARELGIARDTALTAHRAHRSKARHLEHAARPNAAARRGVAADTALDLPGRGSSEHRRRPRPPATPVATS